MDPLSHAVVGATVAGLLPHRPDEWRRLTVVGLLAGMAPDLDVLIRSADNPLVSLFYHRHFTHSVFFAPFAALLLSVIFWLVFKKRLKLLSLYTTSLVAILSHGLLDSLTNYGTHLFWPLTPRRESWGLISIVDPLLTVTLLIFLVVALLQKRKKFLLVGASWMLIYFSFGFYQQQLAQQSLFDLAKQRGHVIERFEVKPSFANLFLWRVQYQYQKNIYIDAVRVSPWDQHKIYTGGSLPLLTIDTHDLSDWSALQKEDLRQFAFFSDGWLSVIKNNDGTMLVGDVRFALLPNQTQPLWGIQKNDNPEKHVNFLRTINRQPDDIQELLSMILGK